MKQISILISTKKDDFVKEIVSEFKEEVREAGYNLREIKSDISDSTVRILWPDEEDDVNYLKNWVQKRVEILDNGKFVTLAYDAEGVCMQFGDIFNENVDYYNWESENESIIISFYKHKGDYDLDPLLVNTMKPLLEHSKVTFITFDFTFDFSKFNKFGINIRTKRIIDSQLMILPEDYVLNTIDDFICSTGWRSIGGFIMRANEDNTNSNIISRAKQSVKNGKKKCPHEKTTS